jgi:hypothetical protein
LQLLGNRTVCRILLCQQLPFNPYNLHIDKYNGFLQESGNRPVFFSALPNFRTWKTQPVYYAGQKEFQTCFALKLFPNIKD